MRARSKTPLFLMELIIMLLVFSVSAAVCLQVFSGAKRISEESSRLDAAVTQAQTTAECWKASGGDLEETAVLMGTSADGNSFTVYDEENDTMVQLVRNGAEADISVFYGEKEIFSLECEAVMIDG